MNGEQTQVEHKSTDRRVKEALEYDPLHEAERATGKHWSESETTGFIGMALAMEHNRHKAEVLSQADDTYMSQSLEQWLGVVERLGFEKMLDEPIEGTADRFRLFWRPGVLLKMDSYWDDKSVNSAGIALCFKGDRNVLPSCSNGHACDVDGIPVWSVEKDAREGLRYFLAQIEAGGEILTKWPKRPFIWLLSYKDSKVEGYDYNAINEARIAKLPEHVRSAINGQ